MTVTPAEIENEHRQALETLTPEQQLALSRVRRANQLSHFNHHRIVDNLQKIFQEEAKRRSETAEQG